MNAAPSSRPIRILAVDDSVTFLHALEERLQQEGYDVALASSGEEALAYLDCHEVDGVLLDLVMPGLSGEETCRRIRADPTRRDVPIVALTSLEGMEPIVRALHAGADDFVTKGDDFTLLDARLGAQLRRRRFEEETRRMREDLLAAEMRATKAEADRALAETRARLLDDLSAKNRELERAKERAEVGVHARDEFLSIASHELRTPVTALWFQVERLQRVFHEAAGVLPPKIEGTADAMARQVKRLADLIEALLDASRIGAGRFSLNVERFDLVAAVRAVVEDLGEAAEQAGSPITLHAEGPLVGTWDRLRIEQMTLNLTHNAVKYGGGKPIDVSVERRETSVRISVRDRGIGIAVEQRERIFSIFERAVSSRNYGGLGLGLYIARAIVEAHGGSIRVSSQPGAGSTFVVDLPWSR